MLSEHANSKVLIASEPDVSRAATTFSAGELATYRIQTDTTFSAGELATYRIQTDTTFSAGELETYRRYAFAVSKLRATEQDPASSVAILLRSMASLIFR